MVQFSIILPAVTCGSAFEDTLASVLRTRPSQSQVLVVHSGGFRDEYGLHDEIDQVVVGSNRLIDAWNGALDRALGEFVVWLSPGANLDDGWEFDCRDGFLDPDVGSVSPLLVIPHNTAEQSLLGIGVDSHGTKRWTKSETEILGPTSLAGAYRQSALGWIDQIDNAWEDFYLDAYLALSLNRLGYRSKLSRSWQVEYESAGPGSVMEVGAHGCSAERATLRFGSPLRPGWSAAFLTDLGNASLGNQRARHWWQRLRARPFAKSDRAANQTLCETKVRRQSINRGAARRAA